MDASLAELDLDNYDDDDMAEQHEVAKGVFGSGNPGMAYYRSNLEDPYIILPSRQAASDSEEEEAELQSTDYVIVSGRHEDDVSLLEASTCSPSHGSWHSEPCMHRAGMLAPSWAGNRRTDARHV